MTAHSPHPRPNFSITESIRWHLGKLSNPPSFLQAHATDVDFDRQTVSCVTIGDDSSGSSNVTTSIKYDHLVVAVGAEPSTFGIKGVVEHSHMMKEIEDSLTVQKKLLSTLEYANALAASNAPASSVERALHWVVVGGGPTGVELTAELCDFKNSDIARYFPHLASKLKITLVEGTPKVLGTFSPHISNYAADALNGAGADVMTGQFVTGVTERTIPLKAAKGGEKSELDYGVMVWAGGIEARPITKKLAETIGGEQLSGLGRGGVRGLKVDEKFRVLGVRNVWALGDCALSGCAPTAQAAYQQGMYLGRLFRDTGLKSGEEIEGAAGFKFRNYGSLAYVGSSKGVADLKIHLWGDRAPAGRGQEAESTVIEGTAAFGIWRSLYFSKMLSLRNRFQVGADWTIGSLFGREISTPWDLNGDLAGGKPKK